MRATGGPHIEAGFVGGEISFHVHGVGGKEKLHGAKAEHEGHDLAQELAHIERFRGQPPQFTGLPDPEAHGEGQAHCHTSNT